MTNIPRWTAPRSPTPINVRLGALVDNQNHLEIADTPFDLGAGSAAGHLGYLDLDHLSPDNSPEESVGLNWDSGVSPSPWRLVSLNLEILEPELKNTVHRDLEAQMEGNGTRV